MSDADLISVSHDQQLLMLRDVTNRTGILHEAQLLQLKIWPRLWFARSTAARSSVDVDKKSLVFEISVRKAASDDGTFAERLGACVRWLLGNDWKVAVVLLTPGRKRSKNRKRYVV